MAIPKELLQNMTGTDKDSYIKMRQALDSLTYVALTEFDLSVPENFSDPAAEFSGVEAKRKNIFDALPPDGDTVKTRKEISDSTRAQISDMVSKAIVKLIFEIGIARGPLWSIAHPDRAADFALHSHDLSAEEFKKFSELSEEERVQSLRGGDPLNCPPGFILVDGICVPI